MRIITGIAKGTKLQTLSGEETRPTTEVVKEGIFSAIQFDVFDRTVLDLFGGCGQLALEALSRGAERAVGDRKPELPTHWRRDAGSLHSKPTLHSLYRAINAFS